MFAAASVQTFWHQTARCPTQPVVLATLAERASCGVDVEGGHQGTAYERVKRLLMMWS